MSTEIIVVKQLPIIVEQLAQVKEAVIARVETATSLVCTDETVKEVKKARAELTAEVKAFIDRIDDDLALIDTQEHKAEILVEYKKTLNASAAVTGVNARFKAIEDEKKRIEEAEIRKAAEEQHIAEIRAAVPEPIMEAVPEPIPEVEAPAEEQLYTLKFTVTATKDKLRELKAFLDNGGYTYG